jgi:hypothetical protein
MTIEERAHIEVVKIYHSMGLEFVHGDPMHGELKALIRMLIRDVTKPFEELCESSSEFLLGGQFFCPGQEQALKRLDRFRRDVEQYGHAKIRLKDAEQKPENR